MSKKFTRPTYGNFKELLDKKYGTINPLLKSSADELLKRVFNKIDLSCTVALEKGYKVTLEIYKEPQVIQDIVINLFKQKGWKSGYISGTVYHDFLGGIDNSSIYLKWPQPPFLFRWFS